MSVAQLLVAKENEFHGRLGEARALNRTKKAYEEDIESLSRDVRAYEQASVLFRDMSKEVQSRFLERIQEVVTVGLQAVFNEPIKFIIDPVIRRGSLELDFHLESMAGEQSDLMDSHGGGLVTLCGVVMRLITVRLLRDALRQVVVLDEPLAMLSERYLEPAAEFISTLSRDLGIQVIMVSHQNEFAEAADKVFRLSRKNGTVVVDNS